MRRRPIYTDGWRATMGVIENVRKVKHDLVVLELKSLAVEVRAARDESRMRDEMTRDLLSAKMDAMSARTEAQYASIMNALDLGRRLDALERDKQAASA
jgi:hypothetical protein